MTAQRKLDEGRPVDSPDPAPTARTAPRGAWYWKVAVSLAAILFFMGPGLAWVAGTQPKAIENRKLAAFPSASDGWNFFPKLGTWTVDHLPLRDRAVVANDQLSASVFGELPATAGSKPKVILGKDGWLYFNDDIDIACTFQAHLPQVQANVTRLDQILRDNGKSFNVVIPPDKTSIETDRLPRRYPLDKCAAAEKQALQRSLSDTPPPGYVDLFGPIREVKREHGTAYKPQDTHWTDYGCVQFAKTLVDHLDPALWPGTQVVAAGKRSAPGDLNSLRGRPGPTTFDAASIHRPGVTTKITEQTLFGESVRVSVSTSSGPPLFPGRTVLIGDSFSDESMDWLAPFFNELVYVRITSGKVTAPGLAKLVSSSDHVVVELVERFYIWPAISILEPNFLNQFEQALKEPK